MTWWRGVLVLSPCSFLLRHKPCARGLVPAWGQGFAIDPLERPVRERTTGGFQKDECEGGMKRGRPLTAGSEASLRDSIFRMEAQILNLVKESFVTDIEDFRSFASVPKCLFENIRDELFFDSTHRFFRDFL